MTSSNFSHVLVICLLLDRETRHPVVIKKKKNFIKLRCNITVTDKTSLFVCLFFTSNILYSAFDMRLWKGGIKRDLDKVILHSCNESEDAPWNSQGAPTANLKTSSRPLFLHTNSLLLKTFTLISEAGESESRRSRARRNVNRATPPWDGWGGHRSPLGCFKGTADVTVTTWQPHLWAGSVRSGVNTVSQRASLPDPLTLKVDLMYVRSVSFCQTHRWSR